MRKLLLPLVFLLLITTAYSQSLLKKIDGGAGVTKQFIKLEDAEQVIFSSKNAKSIFGLNPSSGLSLIRSETDKLGMVHYRYTQTYNNIPVENSMYIAHTKGGKLTSMSGSIVTKFDPKTAQRTTATLSPAKAIASALNYVHAEKYAWQDADFEQRTKLRNGKTATYYPVPSKVWYSGDGEVNPSALTLAYKIDVYTLKPFDRKFIYVDAATGKILGEKQEMMHTDAVGTAATGYSGSQTIHSDMTGTNAYRLRDLTKGNGIITLHAASGHADYTNTSANWALTGADKWALDAHFGVAATWTYYKNNFNRNSVDNAGYALTSWVNDASNTDNADWDGSEMDYGNLSSNGNGVTAIDVTGHELTHGVTQYTCNLTYSKEPGAMNESISDMAGKSVQFYTKPTDTSWILSNDMGWEIRSFANPKADGQPDTYKGTNWVTSRSDNYGVHTNSGVGNHMFYLLVMGGSGTNDISSKYTVTGIGLAEADQIIYRSQTVYLTSSSQYADFRTACINAATDLYGATSNEVIQVENAWYAVGVGTAGVVTCSTPSGLAVSAITNTSATFSWTAVSGSTGYNLQYRVVGTTAWTSATSTTTSYSATGLTLGSSYEVQVQNKCSATSTSAFSASVNFTTTGGAPCTVPTGLAVSSITASGAAVTWTAVSGATGYTLQYKLTSASTFTTVTGITTPSYSLTGLTPGSAYQVQVATVCSATSSSAYSTALPFTTSAATITYCTSTGTTTYEYINKVVLGTISNTSGNNTGYGNYTALSTALTAGSTYSITLTPGFASTKYAEFWTVYIDYNQDGTLNGTGETVLEVKSTKTGTATGSFKVPTTAKSGSTRLRIQMHYGSYSTNPCGSYTYGEVEDYTVNISDGTGFAAQELVSNKSAIEIKGMSVYPNPIQGTTATVNYQLAKDGQVALKVVDLLGRYVQSINLGNQTQGSHTYILNRSKEVTTGNYFIVLYQNNEVVGRNKIIVLTK